MKMKKYIPLLSGFILMTILVSLIEYISMKQTGWHLCYPIDDSFIHMAVAKNLALHGNWGINASEWVSASSSPLFTVSLSILDKIFSVQVGLPLVLSSIGTVLIIFAMQEEMDNHSSLNMLNKTICIIGILIIVPYLPSAFSAWNIHCKSLLHFSLCIVWHHCLPTQKINPFGLLQYGQHL